MTDVVENEREPKQYPSGIFGFLARLRDSETLAGMPASWVKVMIVLLSHRNPQGYCWPSQRVIAKEAGVSIRTVQIFLKWAKASLGLRISKSRYNSYYFPLYEKIDSWMPSFRNTATKAKRQHTKELETEKAKNGGIS